MSVQHKLLLPHYLPSDIVTLQHTDPVIKEVLIFWRHKQHPNKEQRKNGMCLIQPLCSGVGLVGGGEWCFVSPGFPAGRGRGCVLVVVTCCIKNGCAD